MPCQTSRQRLGTARASAPLFQEAPKPNQRLTATRADSSHATDTYDDIGEVQSSLATNSVGTAISTEKFGYSYDAALNMSKRTNNGSATTYTLNNLNEITSGGTYDSNGNRTFSTWNETSYEYDDENQLTAVMQIYGSQTFWWRTEFTYDGKGRLHLRAE